ncbi:MAG: phosphodiester glycosidase family protein [Elusimicrobia bacterium]|nr:phosphodiester glycosidase family protein [Elusimicrobiota bacterium]
MPTPLTCAVLLAAILMIPARCFAGKSLGPGLTYDSANGYHVVAANLDSAQTEVRVALPHAKPAENMLSVAQWAKAEDAYVAVNANYFGGPVNHPCGAARGHGVQHPGIYAEAGNCVTTMGWARGKGAVFSGAGHEADAAYVPQFTELATGGGLLLQGGRRRDWNHSKLEERRACTAVGLSADRKRFIFVVTDSRACTGKGLQDVLLANGASDAIHLDGGGSSKMWVRGIGYVNDVSENRRPSVAIVAKPREQGCPQACGSAQCVQTFQTKRAECVGKPCRGGLSSAWSCDSTLRRRLRCRGGLVAVQSCATVCIPKPSGAVCSPCSSGNGYYCGGDGVLGDAKTLFFCSKGALTQSKKCPKRCVVMPPGRDDRCE